MTQQQLPQQRNTLPEVGPSRQHRSLNPDLSMEEFPGSPSHSIGTIAPVQFPAAVTEAVPTHSVNVGCDDTMDENVESNINIEELLPNHELVGVDFQFRVHQDLLCHVLLRFIMLMLFGELSVLVAAELSFGITMVIFKFVLPRSIILMYISEKAPILTVSVMSMVFHLRDYGKVFGGICNDGHHCIISNDKKVGGPLRSESSFEVFCNMIVTNTLQDLCTIGGSYMWVGSRYTHVVRTKIDRDMANTLWTDMFPWAYAQLLHWMGSDHRPLMVYTDLKI
ncbi:unnamed protein product, partial [Thlaspi arvense]